MKTFPPGSQVLPRKPSREKIRFPFDRRAGLSSAKGGAGTEEEESEGNDISSWTGAELFMTARFLQSAFFFCTVLSAFIYRPLAVCSCPLALIESDNSLAFTRVTDLFFLFFLLAMAN